MNVLRPMAVVTLWNNPSKPSLCISGMECWADPSLREVAVVPTLPPRSTGADALRGGEPTQTLTISKCVTWITYERDNQNVDARHNFPTPTNLVDKTRWMPYGAAQAFTLLLHITPRSL